MMMQKQASSTMSRLCDIIDNAKTLPYAVSSIKNFVLYTDGNHRRLLES